MAGQGPARTGEGQVRNEQQRGGEAGEARYAKVRGHRRGGARPGERWHCEVGSRRLPSRTCRDAATLTPAARHGRARLALPDLI